MKEFVLKCDICREMIQSGPFIIVRVTGTEAKSYGWDTSGEYEEMDLCVPCATNTRVADIAKFSKAIRG